MAYRMLLIILLFSPVVCLAEFSGSLELYPEGCIETRKCKIKEALTYTDPQGLVWQAAKDLVTDGASIPGWAQSVIGNPYDDAYLKAAIVHDHYCDHPVRSWRSTHRAFYEMLITLNLPKVKAKTMYYAVYIGGPKWVALEPGNDCGENCINKFDSLTLDEKTQYDTSRYNDIDDLASRLNSIESRLNQNPEMTLEEIENIAILEFPDYEYFNLDDTKFFDPNLGVTQ